MLFNSWTFLLFFLPVTVAGFFLIGARGHHRIAIAWLVGTSLVFYGWWNPAYLGLLLASMLFNYALGVQLAQRNGERMGKTLLILGVAANLAVLGYYKYANFFVDTAHVLTGMDLHLERIILPLAISFFTFQQVAYLVDAWQGQTREYNFLHYSLFVIFFPQLIAGPIVHHREILPQFARNDIYRPSADHFAAGLTILAIGLFKKVVIADNMAPLATPVFDAAARGEAIDFFSAWTGVFAYTFQLYFDFSGYSDMAIGLARLFGIRLPLNFHSPYRATNIIDFWRRWHMTLSRFLRDYLYIPLGGNRKGPARRHINLLVTMLLGGLWHGAGWTYVVWGGLHGFYLVVNHLWRGMWTRPLDRWWSRLIARSLTLLAVMVAWVFFRAQDFAAAQHLLSAMANLPDAVAGLAGPLADPLRTLGIRFEGGTLDARDLELLLWLVFWMTVVWYWPNTQEWMARARPACDDTPEAITRPLPRPLAGLAWNTNMRWAVTGAVLMTASLLSLSRISEFLYFQF